MIQKTDLPDAAARRRKLDKISSIMDSSIRLPGGYRIGWDGIIGLIPGIGDLVGMGISMYILVGAMRLGASRTTLLRMVSNIGVETAIGFIPVFGDLFDLAFKANSRNMKILNNQYADPAATHTQSGVRVTLWVIAAVVLFLLLIWLVVSTLFGLLSWIF